MGSEFVLFDVPKEPYYRHSHLPGAVNLSLEEIGRAPEVSPNEEAEVVIYLYGSGATEVRGGRP